MGPRSPRSSGCMGRTSFAVTRASFFDTSLQEDVKYPSMIVICNQEGKRDWNTGGNLILGHKTDTNTNTDADTETDTPSDVASDKKKAKKQWRLLVKVYFL